MKVDGVRRSPEAPAPIRDPDIVVRRARRGEIPALLEASSTAIGASLADLEVVFAVFDRDSDAIWTFERRGQLVGAISFLLLTPSGVDALLDGTLNPAMPQSEFLASPHVSPAGVYFWSLYSTPRGSAALGRIFAILQRPRFAKADLWAVPFTEGGRRFVTNWGFKSLLAVRSNVYRYRRASNAEAHHSVGGIQ
jgi:hypothetical protein